MNVLIVAPWFSSPANGAARVLRDWAEGLAEGGHHVSVLTFAEPVANHAAKGVALHEVRASRIPFMSSLLMFRRLLALRSAGDAEVVVAGVAYPTAVIVALAGLIRQMRFLVYSHGEDVACVQGSRLRARLLRWALGRSLGVATNSNFTRDQVIALGIAENRVECVPPGTDLDRFQAVDASAVCALRERLGLKPGKVILTVGRFDERKGHDVVVRAMAGLTCQAPRLQYVIVGGGDSSHVRAVAADRGVADRVHIVPFVAEADMGALYALCDVYVMVSRTDPGTHEVEGFGIVYLEAAAAGKPSVAGSHGGCGDAVEHGVSGIVVDPTDVASVREAMGRLLLDPDLARTMGAAGARVVAPRYSRRASIDRFVRLFTRRTGAQPGPRGPMRRGRSARGMR
jgi:phosphatidylinositol alpha-1,6-mannosyltransferase